MDRRIRLFTGICFIFLLAGCLQETPSEKPPVHLNPNMDDQPKYEAMEESKFWTDHSSMREPVEGTLARGHLDADRLYYEGKNANGSLVKISPLRITEKLLKRGQERFNIFCAPCHGLAGDGQGIIIKKGFVPPPSFHIDRLRQVEDGHIFNVITHGLRNMPSYQYQVPVADRWAIVAYVRALQRSQNATATDIPEDIRNTLK